MNPEVIHDPKADLSTGRILLIDKPLRWTSFDAVNRIKRVILQDVLKDVEDPTTRRTLKKKLKVGHAGTLDPLATGLLIICTGPMTKQIMGIQAQEKEYTGTITLGAITPTYDLESEPEQHQPLEGITEESIRAAAAEFVGKISQLPPIHSAIRIAGERAYDLARKGAEVPIQAREIEIKEFSIGRIALPEVDFKVVCSKGTYIRSLAHDIGQKLGCGGYLSTLRRTRIGSYSAAEAVSPAAFLS